jgi:hypothetical protein
MNTGHHGIVRPLARGGNAVILFWVGPFRLGIDAGALKEIRNGGSFVPEDFGCEVILSARAFFGIPGGPEGHLLVLRPGAVGLGVDRVERMVETIAPAPLPQAFQGVERTWYCGIAFDGESVIPLVNPQALVRETISARSSASEPHSAAPEFFREATSP